MSHGRASVRRWQGCLLLGMLMLLGCGTKRGDVSGKVTYQNTPLVYGTVVIFGRDGIPLRGAIQPDGTYSIKGVPAGPARLAVVSELPPAKLPKKKKSSDKLPPPPTGSPSVEVPKGWFEIPAKYGDPNKSGLEFTVQPGPNSHDIPLP